MPLPDSSHAARKRPRSSRTSDVTQSVRVRKREQLLTEVAMRASIVDEEMRQQRAREVGVGASSSMSTTNGALTVDDSTT